MAGTDTPPWQFDANRAALLVIDMQRDFVEEGAVAEVAMARERIPAMARVIAACRTSGIPVIYTRHTLSDDYAISPLEIAYQPWLKDRGLRPGTRGVGIVQDLAPQAGDTVIVKHRYDAFHDTPLQTILRNLRGPGVIDTLIVTGTVTSVCCESTARSAFMRDYKVAFISDANGGLDQASHDATLSIMAKVFARVMSVDELLSEMAG